QFHNVQAIGPLELLQFSPALLLGEVARLHQSLPPVGIWFGPLGIGRGIRDGFVIDEMGNGFFGVERGQFLDLFRRSAETRAIDQMSRRCEAPLRSRQWLEHTASPDAADREKVS